MAALRFVSFINIFDLTVFSCLKAIIFHLLLFNMSHADLIYILLFVDEHFYRKVSNTQ
jgi:hypothetical protein